MVSKAVPKTQSRVECSALIQIRCLESLRPDTVSVAMLAVTGAEKADKDDANADDDAHAATRRQECKALNERGGESSEALACRDGLATAAKATLPNFEGHQPSLGQNGGLEQRTGITKAKGSQRNS